MVTVVDHDKRCLVTQAKCPEVDECALHYTTIPVDKKGRCVLSEQVGEEKTCDDRPKHWKCCELCKTADLSTSIFLHYRMEGMERKRVAR